MAWPTWTTEDGLSGEGAELEGQYLFNRDLEMSYGGNGATWYIPSSSINNGSFAVVSTMSIIVPAWMETGGVFKMGFNIVKGTGTPGSFKLEFYNGSSWLAGGTVTSGATGAVEIEYTLVGDEGGILRQLRVQASAPAADWTINAEALGKNLRFYAP